VGGGGVGGRGFQIWFCVRILLLACQLHGLMSAGHLGTDAVTSTKPRSPAGLPFSPKPSECSDPIGHPGCSKLEPVKCYLFLLRQHCTPAMTVMCYFRRPPRSHWNSSSTCDAGPQKACRLMEQNNCTCPGAPRLQAVPIDFFSRTRMARGNEPGSASSTMDPFRNARQLDVLARALQ
jgi:hypothetical protein